MAGKRPREAPSSSSDSGSSSSDEEDRYWSFMAPAPAEEVNERVLRHPKRAALIRTLAEVGVVKSYSGVANDSKSKLLKIADKAQAQEGWPEADAWLAQRAGQPLGARGEEEKLFAWVLQTFPWVYALLSPECQASEIMLRRMWKVRGGVQCMGYGFAQDRCPELLQASVRDAFGRLVERHGGGHPVMVGAVPYNINMLFFVIHEHCSRLDGDVLALLAREVVRTRVVTAGTAAGLAELAGWLTEQRNLGHEHVLEMLQAMLNWPAGPAKWKVVGGIQRGLMKQKPSIWPGLTLALSGGHSSLLHMLFAAVVLVGGNGTGSKTVNMRAMFLHFPALQHDVPAMEAVCDAVAEMRGARFNRKTRAFAEAVRPLWECMERARRSELSCHAVIRDKLPGLWLYEMCYNNVPTATARVDLRARLLDWDMVRNLLCTSHRKDQYENRTVWRFADVAWLSRHPRLPEVMERKGVFGRLVMVCRVFVETRAGAWCPRQWTLRRMLVAWLLGKHREGRAFFWRRGCGIDRASGAICMTRRPAFAPHPEGQAVLPEYDAAGPVCVLEDTCHADRYPRLEALNRQCEHVDPSVGHVGGHYTFKLPHVNFAGDVLAGSSLLRAFHMCEAAELYAGDLWTIVGTDADSPLCRCPDSLREAVPGDGVAELAVCERFRTTYCLASKALRLAGLLPDRALTPPFRPADPDADPPPDGERAPPPTPLPPDADVAACAERVNRALLITLGISLVDVAAAPGAFVAPHPAAGYTKLGEWVWEEMPRWPTGYWHWLPTSEGWPIGALLLHPAIAGLLSTGAAPGGQTDRAYFEEVGRVTSPVEARALEAGWYAGGPHTNACGTGAEPVTSLVLWGTAPRAAPGVSAAEVCCMANANAVLLTGSWLHALRLRHRVLHARGFPPGEREEGEAPPPEAHAAEQFRILLHMCYAKRRRAAPAAGAPLRLTDLGCDIVFRVYYHLVALYGELYLHRAVFRGPQWRAAYLFTRAGRMLPYEWFVACWDEADCMRWAGPAGVAVDAPEAVADHLRSLYVDFVGMDPLAEVREATQGLVERMAARPTQSCWAPLAGNLLSLSVTAPAGGEWLWALGQHPGAWRLHARRHFGKAVTFAMTPGPWPLSLGPVADFDDKCAWEWSRGAVSPEHCTKYETPEGFARACVL